MTNPSRAHIAAIVLILLSGALSTAWAFLVPIFQAPDEPAHFDYAISIYSAGRLIRLADGRSDWLVSPYTSYLMRASDSTRIVERSSMRVPRGYGTASYFARLSARAPRLNPPIAPEGHISYLVGAYPFGFYALEAVWMHAISLLAPSLVALFFGARLLCVLLVMLGLYFNYRTAMNIGVPPWTAVALTGAIGLLPLTSWVSSYIQPDNLAYALVSACLFFATELRKGRLRFVTAVPLGIGLGLLAITKYQFFLAAAIPIALLFAYDLVRAKLTGARRFALFAAFAAPAAALLAVQHWVVNQSGAEDLGGITSPAIFDAFRSTLAMGSLATIRYVVGSGLEGFMNCFVSGGCAATFWGVVGWVDTPIVILNGTVETWVRAAISLLTLVVVVVLVFYSSRNSLRLLAAAGRGHPLLAVGPVVRDPVFNSYVCIVAIMLSLYILTNNAFGVEGRQWYAYIFPALLCFAWYTPRALSKHHHRVSSILAFALLCYAIMAAAYALYDVAERYYGPSTARYTVTHPDRGAMLPGHARGVLWPVEAAAYHVNGPGFPFSFVEGSALVASGVLPPYGDSRSAVAAVVLDERTALPVLSGQYQYLIAEATHSLTDGYSAFFVNISTKATGEGPHVVAAYASLPGIQRYQPISPVRLFFLTGPDGRFSASLLRTLRVARVVGGTLRAIGACRGDLSAQAEGPTVAQGAVLLLAGKFSPDPRAAEHSGIWFLIDDRPYPARYDARARSFLGTIPTATLTPGAHRVFAYALGGSPFADDRISQGASFYLREGPGGRVYPRSPPPVCADPLRQLSGT